MASEAVQVVEQYLQALRDKNASKAPLADDGQIVEAQAFLDPRPFLSAEP